MLFTITVDGPEKARGTPVAEWVSSSVLEAIDVLTRSGRADLASDLNRVVEGANLSELDMLRSPRADALLDQLVEIDSAAGIRFALEQIAEVFSVHHCTIHVVKEGVRSTFRTRVITTYPDEWIERYVSSGYEAVDPVMGACLSTDTGFYWDSIDTTAPGVASFMSDATRHGVGPAGYTQIVQNDTGDTLAVSLSSSGEQHAFRGLFEGYVHDLSVLSAYLVEAFTSIVGDTQPDDPSPSEEQIMMLRMIAEGVCWEELQGIKFKTAPFDKIAAATCNAFGTQTVMQAAVHAARMGLLDAAPLTTSNIFAGGNKMATPSSNNDSNVAAFRRKRAMRRCSIKGLKPGKSYGFAEPQ